MKLTAKVKLLPTREQSTILEKTLEIANNACNYISEQAWEHKTFRQFPLHKLVYYDVREKYLLSAQVVERCISKVADSYKTGHKITRAFRLYGAIAFDDRILRWHIESREVSIWTVNGRQHIPFVCGKRQEELLQGRRGESDLSLINGEFYLLATCDVESPEPIDVHDVLGCDFGIVNLVTDSDGEQFSGDAVEDNRRKSEHLRRNLQKKQTKSATRKLKKISGRQARFQSNTNHTISKRLVAKAQDTRRAIALEDLSGIREAPVRRKQRSKHANWSFYQLRQYISYKAKLVGIPVILVDPKYTSQRCSVCGHVSKSNRKSQSSFLCVSCGHSANADTNAAINIARAAVNQPNEPVAQGLASS
jgi:IS605 OrfB family transposase